MPLFKKKLRLFSLLSLVLLAQCCCIVVPFQAQVKNDQPVLQGMLLKVDDLRFALASSLGRLDDLAHLVANAK